MLRNQLEILRAAQVGERNHTLNRCAFTVARFVSAGHIDDNFARGELRHVALQIGLAEWETTRTITSAFTAGGNTALNPPSPTPFRAREFHRRA